jgi:DNA-binding HxlR family transcriptional regulator
LLEPSEKCPLSPCIKLLSPTWTLEIVYFLSVRKYHFGELRRALGKISSKVLTDRLRTLEEKLIIHRLQLPTNPPKVEYSLTAMGQQLLPVLDAFSQVSQTLQSDYGLFINEN